MLLKEDLDGTTLLWCRRYGLNAPRLMGENSVWSRMVMMPSPVSHRASSLRSRLIFCQMLSIGVAMIRCIGSSRQCLSGSPGGPTAEKVNVERRCSRRAAYRWLLAGVCHLEERGVLSRFALITFAGD